jgi:hypothetical protein
MHMNNPKIIQVQFEMNFGEISFTLHALIKPTEHPLKFHVLRVQSLNTRENAAVIDDFHIIKMVQESTANWVHIESGASSGIVQAIGKALDKHISPVPILL